MACTCVLSAATLLWLHVLNSGQLQQPPVKCAPITAHVKWAPGGDREQVLLLLGHTQLQIFTQNQVTGPVFEKKNLLPLS